MKLGKVSRPLAAAFLSLLSLNTNAFGMDIVKKEPQMQREDKVIADKDALVPYDCNYNVLVVADTVERMQKVAALMHNNKKNTKLGDLSNNLKNYEIGKVYKAENNPKVNILCITIDDFNNQDSSYDWYWDVICQETGFVYYIFKSKSDDDAECYEKLKKFYHKFNKHWCGKDFNYDENYEPFKEDYYDAKSGLPPIGVKDRAVWFNYVLKKRHLLTKDHRYIFFINDDNKKGYSKDFEDYVGNMPDARSIDVCELNRNFNSNKFSGYINYKVPFCGVPFEQVKKKPQCLLF